MEEVHRNQINKFGWNRDLADYWYSEVTRTFPEAMISDYEKFIELCTNDAKDRHVLAAAVRCEADSIVTFNLKHFPVQSLLPWELEVSGPSSFLIAMYDMQPAVVMAKLDDMASDRQMERLRMLGILHKTVPTFASRVALDLGLQL